MELLALSAACGADPEAGTTRAQLSSSKIISRELTGVGVFTHFKTDSENLIEDTDGGVLRGSQGVSLSHPELEHGADVIVWVENGKMDCLEMVTFGAEKWPFHGEFQLSPTNHETL